MPCCKEIRGFCGANSCQRISGTSLPDGASDEESGFLALENEAGDTYRLSGEQLSNYLDGTMVRLVVLAACETAIDSTPQRFVGVGQRLMRASNVPAVVAMQFSIPDTSAVDEETKVRVEAVFVTTA